MDYIPAHQTYQSTGIIYKVPELVGKSKRGVQYYKAKFREYPEQGNKLIESDALSIEERYENQKPKYKITLKARKNPQPSKVDGGVKYKLDYKTAGVSYTSGRDPEAIEKANAAIKSKAKHKDLTVINSKDKYFIPIQKQMVDFSAEGIEPAKLSRSDQAWLEKARFYFINATESGRKIGSAESYTTPEILEALWATAEAKDIDPKRFLVQIYNETRFNPNLTGRAGEKGLGQFKRSTAKGLNYDWGKMKSGVKGYAYQAKCAAEFVAQVGESTYNGGHRGSHRYVSRIDKHLKRIANTSVPKTVAKL